MENKRIPRKEDNPKGLHQRFYIQKFDEPRVREDFFGNDYYEPCFRPVDPNAEYFVLRLDIHGTDPKHITACREAINTYANHIESSLPELAKDLRERYPVISDVQTCQYRKCKRFATTTYGGTPVCRGCSDRLNNEFDEEYR